MEMGTGFMNFARTLFWAADRGPFRLDFLRRFLVLDPLRFVALRLVALFFVRRLDDFRLVAFLRLVALFFVRFLDARLFAAILLRRFFKTVSFSGLIAEAFTLVNSLSRFPVVGS